MNKPKVLPFTEWLALQDEDKYICPICRAKYFHCHSCQGTGIDNKRARRDYRAATKAAADAWQRWNQQAAP